MSDILEKLSEYGVVPVVVLNRAEDAKPLAKALCEGGLKCAEVTFRTAAAEESIKIMTENYPDMLVGAGTVLTTEQVDRAVGAGAKFIVSPGFDPEIVDYCISKNIVVVPHSLICAGAKVDHAIIGQNVIITPGAEVIGRPGEIAVVGEGECVTWKMGAGINKEEKS